MALPGDPRKSLVPSASSPWRAALERWIRIIQGNFDHMDGVITEVQKRHNALDDNVQELTEFVNENLDQVVEHTHEDDGEGGVLPTPSIAHVDTTGQTPDDHHSEDHDIDGAHHSNFPGGTTDFLREDGTWATPSGGADNLSDLTDVDTTVDSASGGESLVYNGGASQWQAQTLNTRLDGLTDVSVTEGPGIDTYVLTWDDGLSAWIASPAGGGPSGSAGVLAWESLVAMATGDESDRFYFSSAKTIDYVYVSLALGDGVSTFTADVKLNGTSIYPVAAKPVVTTGNYVGADAPPDTTAIADGDYLTIRIDADGGATGRARVYVVFA